MNGMSIFLASFIPADHNELGRGFAVRCLLRFSAGKFTENETFQAERFY